jgi:hypothetical protein
MPHAVKPVYSAVAAAHTTTKTEEKAAEVCGGGLSAECVERLSTPKLQRITVHCTRVPPRKAKEAPEHQVSTQRQGGVRRDGNSLRLLLSSPVACGGQHV